MVHVARMKRYVDPASCPICQPPDDIDEPYLLYSDLISWSATPIYTVSTAYVTGLQSTMQCQKQHYANSFYDCKQWVLCNCHASSPQESTWLASTHG